jgi:hypothetical protein
MKSLIATFAAFGAGAVVALAGVAAASSALDPDSGLQSSSDSSTVQSGDGPDVLDYGNR